MKILKLLFKDVFTFLTCISIILSIVCFSEMISFKSRLKQTNGILQDILKLDKYKTDELLRNEIVKLKIEKESYTTILGSQSDWIIAYVSILFIIFGLYGFIVSRNLIKEEGKQYKKKTKKQERVISDHEKVFLDLEWKLLNNAADVSALIAFSFRSENSFKILSHSTQSASNLMYANKIKNVPNFESRFTALVEMALNALKMIDITIANGKSLDAISTDENMLILEEIIPKIIEFNSAKVVLSEPIIADIIIRCHSLIEQFVNHIGDKNDAHNEAKKTQ